MRFTLMRGLVAAGSLAVAACGTAGSSVDGGTLDSGLVADAGEGTDAGLTTDGGSFDAGGLPVVDEVEPNGTSTMFNTLTLPTQVRGTVAAADGGVDDYDAFRAAVAIGTLWTWTLVPSNASLAPYLSIVEIADKTPRLVVKGLPGATVRLEHFALKTSSYSVVVTDARNVPPSSSQHQGGPSLGYTLEAARSNRAPVTLSVPTSSPVSASLSSATGLGYFSFTLTADTSVTVWARAKTKALPSEVDTRLSLYRVDNASWVGTNDDAPGASSDSKLSGTLPAGSYAVIIDNLNAAATDLSYEVSVSTP